ncbi:class II aldolase/adducin family protein [Bradyrhizobium sp.]|jgi:rhamnose utilization protein RhaD (predicted bifunctional aldolase and dehydrogenase)|uniref:class II aldolase/adducin family protein n=1 Tax=Bradyrhizobium sp. TaxID=376 RepID=UPI002BC249EF|nr:class II aldolase/adducin family protein [Bradyrhizobium sp.]HWX62376.1 class II aldolase/adducin family protein [Bradyrhizobium sp.]
MQEPAALNDLRRMSARVGKNILLTQAAGGNSSIKLGDVLWVKASGAWLADAEDKDVFLGVSLSGARAALAEGNERMPLAPGRDSPLRASIETSLHALMPHPVVLHVHSVNTIAWSVRTDASDKLAARLQGLAWHRLDYHHPGLPLARAVSESLARGAADVLILGNHGLVVGAPTCDAAEALVMEIERRLALVPRSAALADNTGLARVCAGTDYRPVHDALCHQLATDRHNLRLVTAGSLYPDHVIFLGPALPALAGGETLTAKAAHAASARWPAPVAVLVPGKGAVIRNDATTAAHAMLSCLVLVASRLPLRAQIKYLPERAEQALLNWDAERYRQQMTASR